MKVINRHQRIINQPVEKVEPLFNSLATSEDKIWPSNHWPAICFENGINLGSRGGHGRIRYTITEYKEGRFITFNFTEPIGFNGIHELSINPISETISEIKHTIQMYASFKASLLWCFVIRWCHDALIEEAFDKVDNYFSEVHKVSNYNLWVKTLRSYYKWKAVQN